MEITGINNRCNHKYRCKIMYLRIIWVEGWGEVEAEAEVETWVEVEVDAKNGNSQQ